jgi:hypothetical protein
LRENHSYSDNFPPLPGAAITDLDYFCLTWGLLFV